MIQNIVNSHQDKIGDNRKEVVDIEVKNAINQYQ